MPKNPKIIFFLFSPDFFFSVFVLFFRLKHRILTTAQPSHIFFPTKVNRGNEGDLYSACSNPTVVESHAALLAGGRSADITHNNFGTSNIKHLSLLL